MTTAHRPTWAPAKGGEEQGGMRIFAPSRMTSAKNQAAHTKLKFRQTGQASVDDLGARDLKAELQEKERKHFAKPASLSDFEAERKRDLELLTQGPAGAAAGGGPAAGGGGGGGGGAGDKKLVPKAIDADESEEESGESSSSSSSDEEDDDEDEEAALLAELERIKKERAEEAAKKAAEDAARALRDKEAELAGGNPLLAGLAGATGGQAAEPSFAVKRRWDEDVVFKNQARGEPKAQKRFINDTIRNDFHRRFLNRYIK